MNPQILNIAGTDYDAAARAVGPILVDGWGWDLDGDTELEFHEVAPGVSPRFLGGQAVTLRDPVTSTYLASGVIVSTHPRFDEHENWTFGYLVKGFKYLCNKIRVTAIDGTATWVFNLPPTDPDYLPSMSGQSVAQIIQAVITQHSTQLSAFGITATSTTTADLTAADLAYVPFDPVYVSGERLGNAFDSVLRVGARNFRFWIDPTGVMRFTDCTVGTSKTLTMGTDPVLPPAFTRDITDCFTRVEIVGGGDIRPAYVSLGRSSLTKAWTSAQQTAWNYSDFQMPGDSYSSGTVVTILDPFTVRVQPTSGIGPQTWAANFWSGRQAWLHVFSAVGSGLAYTESVPVTACTALTTGGTSDLTLGFPLQNSGSAAYGTYTLIGTYAPVGTGNSGEVDVWRLYDVTDPGSQIADHLVKQFPVEVPFMSYSGGAEANTLYPIAQIVDVNGACFPATFKVLPLTGQLLFDAPVVVPFNSVSALAAGGSSVTAPADLYVLLAYSRGAMTIAWPADVGGNPPDTPGTPQYGGLGFTGPEALQTTKYVPVDDWVYIGNAAQMQSYAKMLWKSMCDPIVTGTVEYLGAYTDGFAPGILMNIAGRLTTGYESLNVPVRAFRLDYEHKGGATLYHSRLSCSSARNPVVGDRRYLHPTTRQQAVFKLDFAGHTLDLTGFAQAGAPGLAGLDQAGPSDPFAGYAAWVDSWTPAPDEPHDNDQVGGDQGQP